jgi:hypothetical protein
LTIIVPEPSWLRNFKILDHAMKPRVVCGGVPREGIAKSSPHIIPGCFRGDKRRREKEIGQKGG